MVRRQYWWLLIVLTSMVIYSSRKLPFLTKILHRISLRLPLTGRYLKERLILEFLFNLLDLNDINKLTLREKISLAIDDIENFALRSEISNNSNTDNSMTNWLSSHPLMPFRIKRLAKSISNEKLLFDELRGYLERKYYFLMQREQVVYSIRNTLFKLIGIAITGLLIIALYLPIFKLGSVI